MLGLSENPACTFHIRWNKLVTFQDKDKQITDKDNPVQTFTE